MDCSQAEELFAPYLLGALTPDDRRLLDSHMDTCDECSRKFGEAGQPVEELALALHQVAVPSRVKERLFSRIEAEGPTRLPLSFRSRLDALAAAIAGPLMSHTGKALAGVMVVGLVFGGIWFNSRLDRISSDSEDMGIDLDRISGNSEDMGTELDRISRNSEDMGTELDRISRNSEDMGAELDRISRNSEDMGAELNHVSRNSEDIGTVLAAAAERETHLMEMVKNNRLFTYEAVRMYATPGTSVNMLWGTSTGSRARGMMMVPQAGTRALLYVLNLPPLPKGKAYQVWLIKGGHMYGSGLFTVDSTGFGQAVIIPVAPFAEFDAMGITIEPAEGSTGPTGSSVLQGDF